MRTQYINKTNDMKQVIFSDNSSVFLRRGESHTSDKEVKMMGKGVVTKEVRTTRRKSPVATEGEE